MIRRSYWRCPTLDEPRTDEEGGNFEERFNETGRYEVADESDANLVGSRIKSSIVPGLELHAPVLDIDLPCTLIESSTPGHFHLYIDKVIRWHDYKALIETLANVGIIEPGYADASIRRGQTFVRKPGIVKGAEAPKS